MELLSEEAGNVAQGAGKDDAVAEKKAVAQRAVVAQEWNDHVLVYWRGWHQEES